MSVCVPEIPDALVDDLVVDIDRKGFAVIPNFVAAEDLARMRRFVATAVSGSNGEYAGFVGPDGVRNSGLDELAKLRQFRDMMKRMLSMPRRRGVRAAAAVRT